MIAPKFVEGWHGSFRFCFRHGYSVKYCLSGISDMSNVRLLTVFDFVLDPADVCIASTGKSFANYHQFFIAAR
jgi:hypothetical protein